METVLFRSDCIDVRTTHDCSILVSYSNSKNFAGINYSISPTPVFNLRVPAQFWKEEMPGSQEDIELSNGEFVRLRNELQKKTLLQVGYVPNYIHQKLNLVLMHDFISIGGIEYIKRDEYSFENINRYSLSKAEVLLTEKDYIKKNIL